MLSVIRNVEMTHRSSRTNTIIIGPFRRTRFAECKHRKMHSGLADLKEPKLRQRDYSPQFALKHMDKDLRLALETAADLSLPLDYTRQLKAIYDQGMETGWKDDDFIGLVRLLEKC